MEEQVRIYIEKYPSKVVELFGTLRRLIYESVSDDIAEILWARLPSYYVGENFVRLIPFKDHINIEAKAVLQHREALDGYRITPKGMVQIYVNRDVPADILKQIFSETLNR